LNHWDEVYTINIATPEFTFQVYHSRKTQSSEAAPFDQPVLAYNHQILLP